jgi:hypothetical protein
VGEALLRFDFVFGVAVGDGVGEVFLCLGEAVGDGVGVAFFVVLFLCLRFGAGVGVAKTFLIFVPNDSSAAANSANAPNESARIKNHFIPLSLRAKPRMERLESRDIDGQARG